MSRSTTTNTVWGELIVSYEGDVQRVTCGCKACGTKTEQILPRDRNPLWHARPQHTPTCPYVTKPVDPDGPPARPAVVSIG
jgi:hypothetical protein